MKLLKKPHAKDAVLPYDAPAQGMWYVTYTLKR